MSRFAGKGRFTNRLRSHWCSIACGPRRTTRSTFLARPDRDFQDVVFPCGSTIAAHGGAIQSVLLTTMRCFGARYHSRSFELVRRWRRSDHSGDRNYKVIAVPYKTRWPETNRGPCCKRWCKRSSLSSWPPWSVQQTILRYRSSKNRQLAVL